MARPTDEPKNRLIGIRLNAELTAFFVDKGGNISENVRKALTEYVKQNNCSVKQKNSNKDSFVKQNNENIVKQNKELEDLRKKFELLSTRTTPDAYESFKNGMYGVLKIISLNDSPKKEKSLVNTGVNTTSESVNTDKFMKLSKDLRMPYDLMYSEIRRLTDSGELMKEGMKFVVHEQGIDIKDFLEVCHEVGADPQKMINETINRMRKGK